MPSTTTAQPLRYGAGYAKIGTHVTASRLLQKPKVASARAEHEAATTERLAVTRERVLQEVQSAIEVARQKGDASAMINGWKVVCQMCGYLAPKRKTIELSVESEVLRAKYAAMSDAELLAIAEGREAS